MATIGPIPDRRSGSGRTSVRGRLTGLALVALVAIQISSVGAAFALEARPFGSSPMSGPVSGVVSVVPTGEGVAATTEAPERLGADPEQERKVWAVVGGLVVVALALSLLTARYWRLTRPTAVPHQRRPSRAHTADSPLPGTPSATGEADVVPVVDHDGLDTGEQDDEVLDLFVEDRSPESR
ncbi:MAG: hypothetical protein KDB09_12490 [Acidimicrobiales bacterium]|nr:hypothetical protein [Acidimicrobiales bacterium]